MASIAIQPQLNGARTEEPLALYVHWPFCVCKCPYCDFNSHVRASVDQDEWREALLADLAHEAALLPGHRLTSIFFGGGTPSLMEPATVEAVIDAARDHWPRADDLEITLEANPNSAEAARFADLAAAGRQPHQPRPAELRRRRRSPSSAAPIRRTRGCARWKPRNGSRPGQLRPDLRAARRRLKPPGQATLDRALGLGTDHLSLYQLTIEPGTRFATMVAKHEFEPLDADASADPVRADAGADRRGRPARL